MTRKSSLKKILLSILSSSILFFSSSHLVFSQDAHLQPTTYNLQPKRILFLNQVRGEECCDVGSLDHLRQQLETFQKYNFPATFVLRYDALTNPKYTKLLTTYNLPLTTKNEYGLLLEITPSLAKASGVPYKASVPTSYNLPPTTIPDWYQAHHAYTIGYSADDRKKLADTAFAQFKAVFGYYPNLTTAWIMDTDTLNYIRETYGSSIHQITREQWGTDSYTLSGGPIHYPYLANKDWVFIPSSLPSGENIKSSDQRDMISEGKDGEGGTLILRQTVSDPLMNYGDPNSAFTSQPNDYVRDGKNIEYFKKLLTQTLNQTTNPYSISIIGLENSMAQEFQDDYTKQIAYISELSSLPSGENIKSSDQQDMISEGGVEILTASQFEKEFSEKWSREQLTLFQGSTLTTPPPNNITTPFTFWITTPHYRVRLLQKDNQLLITDLRIYQSDTTKHESLNTNHSDLSDPYNSYQAQNLSYWITPFLLDGSRFYQTPQAQLSTQDTIKDWFKERILPEFIHREKTFLPWKNDTQTHPVAVFLLSIQPGSVTTKREEENIIIEGKDKDDQPFSLVFLTDNFTLNTVEKNTQHISLINHTDTNLPITWTKNSEGYNLSWNSLTTNHQSLSTRILCQQSQCTFQPSLSDDFDWDTFRSDYYPYLFPELIERTLDNDKTLLYAHNQYAIAGKNPVRFVLIPKDEKGYATVTALQPIISSEPAVKDYFVQNQQGSDGITFIDIVENKVGKYNVTVKLGDTISKTQSIYFAPNCKLTKTYCLTHPLQTWWYIQSMFYTKLRSI